MQQDRRDERRRDDCADRRSSVDDPHRGRSLFDGKPLGDYFRRCWKATPFAHAEQKPADRQHAEPGRETVTGAGDRPENHDREEPAPGPEAIDEGAATGVHQGVGQKEDRRQIAELGVGKGNVLLNGLDGNRQRLAIEVTDRDRRAHENRHAPSHLCKARDGNTIVRPLQTRFSLTARAKACPP